MRDSKRYPKCSHHEIISIGYLQDRVGASGESSQPLTAVWKTQEAMWGLARMVVRTNPVHAYVCRKCGFMELNVDEPASIPVDEMGAEVLVGDPAGLYR